MNSKLDLETSITKQIAELAASYKKEDIPEEVYSFTKLTILDFLGCAFAGMEEDSVRIICEEFLGEKIEPLDILPGARNTDLITDTLAFLNAYIGHAIDYDDTHPLPAHFGSPIIGSLLALVDDMKPVGEHFLLSVIVGYEVGVRVGELLQPEHYEHGFHTTGTVAVFAAAAACAKLLGQNAEQFSMTLSLAATMAAGLKCTFGTMAKPFNAANAAKNGLLAAKLVSRGFTAPENALEHPLGFLSLYKGKDEAELSISAPSEFKILDVLFKFHAACHATHPIIEAIHKLKSKDTFEAEDVENILVEVAPIVPITASIIEPKSGLDCKFSVPQLVAMVLTDHDTRSNAGYPDSMLANERINNLRRKVCVNPIDGRSPACCTVIVDLKNGSQISIEYNFLEEMQDKQQISLMVREKYFSNSQPVVGKETAGHIFELVHNLENVENISETFSKL